MAGTPEEDYIYSTSLSCLLEKLLDAKCCVSLTIDSNHLFSHVIVTWRAECVNSGSLASLTSVSDNTDTALMAFRSSNGISLQGSRRGLLCGRGGVIPSFNMSFLSP